MDLIEENFQKQIDILKEEIRNCYTDEFDNLIYKYNIFNNIKNTYTEKLLETDKYKNILENENILEKIYTKFLQVNINSAPQIFDEFMLETFLNEISNGEEEENEEEEL